MSLTEIILYKTGKSPKKYEGYTNFISTLLRTTLENNKLNPYYIAFLAFDGFVIGLHIFFYFITKEFANKKYTRCESSR